MSPSVFSPDVIQLEDLVHDHGLQICSSRDNLKDKPPTHLISGVCIEAGAVHGAPFGCKTVSEGFPDFRGLFGYILREVSSSSSSKLSLSRLKDIVHAAGVEKSLVNVNRGQLIRLLTSRCPSSSDDHLALDELFVGFEGLSHAALTSYVSFHGIQLPPRCSRDDLLSMLMKHLSEGRCLHTKDMHHGCFRVCSACHLEHSDSLNDTVGLQIHLLEVAGSRMTMKPLHRLFGIHNIEFSVDDSLRVLRRKLRSFIIMLKKGKEVEQESAQRDLHYRLGQQTREKVRRSWPQLVSENIKNRVRNLFREQVSAGSLATFTCACCAEECAVGSREIIAPSDIDLEILRRPDRRTDGKGGNSDPWWLPPDCCVSSVTQDVGVLRDVLVDHRGIYSDDDAGISLAICQCCLSYLRKGRLPATAMANHHVLGPVPDVLKELTIVEEAMIARCRAKCWVVHLKEENENLHLPYSQRAFKGHIIIYPQNPSAIAHILPPALDEVSTLVCVLFVGSTPPSVEWLRAKASPLLIRRERVRNALEWLVEHNSLYKDIEIDRGLLDGLEDEQILPVHIQHVVPDHSDDVVTSRYDGPSVASEEHYHRDNVASSKVSFTNVVVTDVDAHAPANELRAAALRHIKLHGGGYIEIPHGPRPVNEFFNPHLFPMIYPTLFPYGLGGFEDPVRTTKISIKKHVKHLFSLADRRFQEHYSFLFTVFNLIQRREILLHSSLKVRRMDFSSVARNFGSVSPEAVHVVSERVANGDSVTAHTDEELKVLNLMKQVKVVLSHVRGSSAARLHMRNEIRGMMMELGLPSFYVTINPADVYSPVVKFLSGADINIDDLLPAEVPDFMEQSILVAQNPSLAARFFNTYMKAFISCVLGFDPSNKNLEGGVLGLVKSYYGCVEAQGRGTLHCHMIIWLEGALNPNEIKDRVIKDGDIEFQERLLAFLDDTISNCIPEDPGSMCIVPSARHHPCSVTGALASVWGERYPIARQKDLHHLSRACQIHRHSATCFKYWKGPPHPKDCRFGLDDQNFCARSAFDMDSGEITLRCLDGMVNNFNDTMLELIRCNMDIKFIGSGASAKAILYYVTDYITKSQLKAHVAYAALDLAVHKLGEYHPEDGDLTVRAKRLLQRCAYSMISHQELSGPQVCSYLMDLDDHFTSHKFNNLYWTSFERHIEVESPSPECNPAHGRVTNAEIPIETDIDVENCASSDIRDGKDKEFVDDGIGDDEEIEDDNNEVQYDSDEEVGVAVNPAGELSERPSQVLDYRLRGHALDLFSLWDFLAQVEKVPSSRKAVREFGDNEFDERSEDCLVSTAEDFHQLIHDQSRLRPCISFHEDHPQSRTHISRIRLFQDRMVPVPIGCAIPRRDRKVVYARYCRLMLILFKPWRCVTDLRRDGQSWESAFEEFSSSMEVRLKNVIDNIQILHECRDSRDDHFAERLRSLQNKSKGTISDMHETRNDSDFEYCIQDTDILEHLQAIESCRSDRNACRDDTLMNCLYHAQSSGMWERGCADEADIEANGISEDSIECVMSNDTALEDIWDEEYKKRRDVWKKATTIADHRTVSSVDDSLERRDGCTLSNAIRDGDLFRHTSNGGDDLSEGAHIRREITLETDTRHDVDIEDMIREFTLNVEQARAFRIVAEHSTSRCSEQLRMYIGGCGGTGKSRVINVLKEYFRRRNEGRRFRLASYTGVAARNISGMTLHSALSLGQRSKKTGRTKANRDLIAMWEGVDYLFVDEVSMIGTNFMLQISEALIEAKGNTSPFGGINIIFAGDFSQLPPVGQLRLYGRVNTYRVATKQGQGAVLGKLLWLSITIVVILTEVMRQQGTANERFVELLTRLRVGNCTQEDFNLLNTQLIHHVKPNWDREWCAAPIIVSNNDVKDAFNIQAAQSFARRQNRALHWYYCIDSQGGRQIMDKQLQDYLMDIHTGGTNQRLGKIPLVIGMPVIIAHNFDVEGGIVNGCQGLLKKI
jgi:hypothetical protein